MLFLIESWGMDSAIIAHGTSLADLSDTFVAEAGMLLSIGGVSVYSGGVDSETKVVFNSNLMHDKVSTLDSMMQNGTMRFRFNDNVLTIQQYNIVKGKRTCGETQRNY